MKPAVRRDGRPARQLVGLLLHEQARSHASTLQVTPHIQIGVHTRTLLQRGLVELDPADSLGLSVRLTRTGFVAALALVPPIQGES